MNIKKYIEQEIMKALQKAGIETKDAFVSQSNRPDLSDYQSNAAMALAKKNQRVPRDLAASIAAYLKDKPFVSKVSVDGPGFLNLSLSDEFLQTIPAQTEPVSGRTVVIDYGGPNIAKEMHVGHLRSAVIGESLKRIMRAAGDNVIGDVHFGDWGTPIGMLIAQLHRENPTLPYFQEPFVSTDFTMSISDISALYRRAADAFKNEDAFKEEARIATFELQNHRPGYLALWQMFKDKSVAAVKENYDELGVDFDVWLGESDVNDLLAFVLSDLTGKGLAELSDGAMIVRLPEENGRTRAPLILKKSDGAYTYAATDLATIIARQRDFNPQAILYVVDARQREHFEQVFEVARMAHYVDDDVLLEHIAFGTVNGADGKPFKTRAGGVMNLKKLIDLAVDKAFENVPEQMDAASAQKQAHQIAIGALKYQDLKNARTSDYIFDTENFTKSEGRTGAYIQYAIARINSILEKSGESEAAVQAASLRLSHPMEREMLLTLKREPEALEEAYLRREPSVISEYVYELAQKFSTFYAHVSINSEPDEILKQSRLKLICMTRDTLKNNLTLLGIEAPAKMLSKA